ncbi:MAG TPA: SaoD/DsrE family protein [Roseibacillus sp.]|mgnify:FL=1|nr:SaoD/DsrE family protein [Roseibacillus sp.]|tara:strand:+ start:158 stop:535 length:378 start_codon:yes stop_codon:yes gene_type:complete
MKVAYVFRNNMASTFQLATMILPQLEDGSHGATVLGMFFFDDNLYTLRAGDSVGERLAKVAAEQDILLMICDQCALRRNLAEGEFEQCGKGQVTAKGTVAGVVAGCFPQLYEALGQNPPDQVITL